MKMVGDKAQSIVLTAAMAVAAFTFGASDNPRRPGASTSPQKLKLTASALNPVAQAPDSIIIQYSVENVGERFRFLNDPKYVYFEVYGPHNQRVRSTRSDHEPPEFGEYPVVFLPTDGFIGRKVRLSCISSGLLNGPANNLCDWGFQFSDSGGYRVVVRYVSPGPNGFTLESDTVRFRYAP